MYVSVYIYTYIYTHIHELVYGALTCRVRASERVGQCVCVCVYIQTYIHPRQISLLVFSDGSGIRESERARDAVPSQVVHGLRQSLVFEEALEEDRVLDCPGLLPGLTFKSV